MIEGGCIATEHAVIYIEYVDIGMLAVLSDVLDRYDNQIVASNRK